MEAVIGGTIDPKLDHQVEAMKMKAAVAAAINSAAPLTQPATGVIRFSTPADTRKFSNARSLLVKRGQHNLQQQKRMPPLPALLKAAAIYCAVFIAVVEGADQQFICPNRGEPKLDSITGKPLQCLPGRDAETVCGKGYSCFFASNNYQCCPSVEDDFVDHFHTECPIGTLTVLNNNGAPVRCNTRTKQCPGVKMFCSDKSAKPICCEHIETSQSSSTTTSPAPPSFSSPTPDKNTVSSIAHIPNNDHGGNRRPFARPLKIVRLPRPRSLPRSEISKVLMIVNHDIKAAGQPECPDQMMTILNSEGRPVPCGGGSCSQKGMVCHQSICCQDMTSFSEQNLGGGTDQPQPHHHNPLKHDLEDAKALIEQLEKDAAEMAEKAEKAINRAHSAKSAVEPQVKPSLSNLQKSIYYADNEPKVSTAEDAAVDELDGEVSAAEKIRLRLVDGEAGPPAAMPPSGKAHAVATHINANQIDENGKQVGARAGNRSNSVEYKTHGQGGYAVSRKLNRINSHSTRPEQKILAQQFIIDQVYKGWPYDEAFFRPEKPENVAVAHSSGHRPAIVVHFPNRA